MRANRALWGLSRLAGETGWRIAPAKRGFTSLRKRHARTISASAPGTDFARRPSPRALHRRHEGNDRLLCRCARYAARPCDEGAAWSWHRPGWREPYLRTADFFRGADF